MMNHNRIISLAIPHYAVLPFLTIAVCALNYSFLLCITGFPSMFMGNRLRARAGAAAPALVCLYTIKLRYYPCSMLFFSSHAVTFADRPLPPEVQNGTTVMPVKSWLSTKVLMMRGACPHQMG